MFAGYILKKTASGTTSYIVEIPSGGISKTTDKSKATIFPSKAKIKKVKDHAPKKTSGFIIEELSKPESNPKSPIYDYILGSMNVYELCLALMEFYILLKYKNFQK